jgi:hypothetical protein
MPRNRGGFRLPVCQVLLTGLIVGAGGGGLSGFLTGLLTDDGIVADVGGLFYLIGFVGLLAGSVIGLVASALALVATAIYRAFGGRSRRKLIVVAASTASLSTLAALLSLLTIGLNISPWWFVIHGVAVFAIAAFQSHLLVTAARPRSRATLRQSSQSVPAPS